MKQRNRIMASLAAVSLLMSGTAIVQADKTNDGQAHTRPANFHPGHTGRHHQHLLEHLGLDASQRKQAEALLQASRDALQDKRKRMRDIRQQLREATLSDEYDADRVKQLAKQKARLITEITEQRSHTFNRIYQLLTAEQKQHLGDRRNKHQQDLN